MGIKKKKIAVAISGGVDSSVATKILKDQGQDVIGIFLHFWKDENAQIENNYYGLDSWHDAQRVCAQIGIPLYSFNLKKEFKDIVVENFISEYEYGRTPNPCVICNKKVKLGLLLEKAKTLGYDQVATGHYVIKKETKTGVKLFKAKDQTRDQSYFLYTLSQLELKHLIFPLGNILKSEVRQLAKKYKLPTAEKKESREICFIPEKKHNDFLKRNIKMKPGQIKTLKGEIVGQHQGLPLYTIGQRKGVEIGGVGPFYVVKCDYKNNILWVSNNGNDSAIYNDILIANNMSWVNGKIPITTFKAQAVIRYRHKPVNCTVKPIGKNKCQITFQEPQRAITPGQSVVIYKNNEVIGGGVILESLKI